MHSKIMTLAAIVGLSSMTAFAEPVIQAGETLESLSKVQISTTVNGQPGSIQQLVTAGQIKVAAEDLPVSVEDIDGILLEEPSAPEATAKVEAATEKAPVEAPSAKAATETAPAAATEDVVNVEDIDPAQPA